MTTGQPHENMLSFSNGVGIPFHYDAIVDLEMIGELTYGQVLEDIESSRANLSVDSRDELQLVYVDIPRADEKYGIPSRQERFGPFSAEKVRDYFCIDVVNGKAETAATFPVPRSEGQAQRIIRPIMEDAGLTLENVYFDSGAEYNLPQFFC